MILPSPAAAAAWFCFYITNRLIQTFLSHKFKSLDLWQFEVFDVSIAAAQQCVAMTSLPCNFHSSDVTLSKC